MRKTFYALMAGISLFAVAACGDDDKGGGGNLSAEEQAYVDEAMSNFDPEEAEPLSEDDARCMVTSMVQAVGVDTLEDAGLTAESFGDDSSTLPEGLTKDQAEDVVDGIDGCIDMSELFLQGMTEDSSLSDDDKKCLADAFDSKTIRDLMVTMLSQGEEGLEDDPAIMSKVFEVFSKCPGAMGMGG